MWESDAPIQRVAWDGGILWAGAYKGGLSQWQLDAGQIAGYTTAANGLSGNHVTSIAVDGSGQKWLALLDGSLNNTVDGSTFANLTPDGVAGDMPGMWLPMVVTSGSQPWVAAFRDTAVAHGNIPGRMKELKMLFLGSYENITFQASYNLFTLML